MDIAGYAVYGGEIGKNEVEGRQIEVEVTASIIIDNRKPTMQPKQRQRALGFVRGCLRSWEAGRFPLDIEVVDEHLTTTYNRGALARLRN